MLDWHDCECAPNDERDRKDECETQQDDSEAFSPRDYQQGFWS